ncbi:MAG: carbon storage regulator [Syntrophorhabdus sp. PtaB.Bin184]|nr:MAG: carbon storage regulator [Syntrophorhabdus sp. PtaB.Bin184]
MLLINLRRGERLDIDQGRVRIFFDKITDKRVRVAVDAPRDITVKRIEEDTAMKRSRDNPES